jgi:hypothetical protein
MAGPITPSNFGELLWPGIRTIYGLQYREFPEEYSQIFNVESSSMAFEESLLLTGFGQVPEKSVGGSVTYNEPKQGWKHRITHTTYGLGFIVASELVEDDQYGKIRQYPKALARSVRQTIETIAANVLNRAFNNSYTGGDGLELCSDAHLLKGGGTWQNEPSSAADLDETSLEQAFIDIDGWVDDEGLKVNANPKKMIVAVNNVWNSTKLLDSQQTPFDANNSVNPANKIVPWMKSSYLDDPDAWFLTTDVMNGLVFYWRRKPAFTRDNDFDSENAKFKTVFRMSVGWDDPRGVYGSPGA